MYSKVITLTLSSALLGDGSDSFLLWIDSYVGDIFPFFQWVNVLWLIGFAWLRMKNCLVSTSFRKISFMRSWRFSHGVVRSVCFGTVLVASGFDKSVSVLRSSFLRICTLFRQNCRKFWMIVKNLRLTALKGNVGRGSAKKVHLHSAWNDQNESSELFLVPLRNQSHFLVTPPNGSVNWSSFP